MKQIMQDVFRPLLNKCTIFRSFLVAAIIAALAMAVSAPKLTELLQGNEFGYVGDALIVSGVFIAASFITLANLVAGYLIWAFHALLFVAGVLAATQSNWVLFIPLALLAVGYFVLKARNLNLANDADSLQQETTPPRSIVDFPGAKLPSHTKLPYRLYVVTHSLLN